MQRILSPAARQASPRLKRDLQGRAGGLKIYWVWLLWNDGPGGVEAALVLFDVEFPVGIEVS